MRIYAEFFVPLLVCLPARSIGPFCSQESGALVLMLIPFLRIHSLNLSVNEVSPSIWMTLITMLCWRSHGDKNLDEWANFILIESDFTWCISRPETSACMIHLCPVKPRTVSYIISSVACNRWVGRGHLGGGGKFGASGQPARVPE